MRICRGNCDHSRFYRVTHQLCRGYHYCSRFYRGCHHNARLLSIMSGSWAHHSRPRSLAIAGRSSSIPQTHLTAVMGPLCLATPSPPEVASTDPRPRQRPSRPSAWRLWGPLPVSPHHSPAPRSRAARARYGNGFFLHAENRTLVRGGAPVGDGGLRATSGRGW